MKYKLANAIVDFDTHTVYMGEEVIPLEPKVSGVLKLLVDRAGEVVTQQAIFEAEWPGQIFSQTLVQRAITLIRKAIGDDAKNPQVIKTIPKKGYLLLAEQLSKTTIYSNRQKQSTKLIWGSCFILIIFALIVLNWPNKSLEFERAVKLSHSDAIELDIVAQRQGAKVAFLRRELDQALKISIFDVPSQTETLFDVPKGFSTISWSADGASILGWIAQANDVYQLVRFDIQSNKFEPIHTVINSKNVTKALESAGNIYFAATDMDPSNSYIAALKIANGEVSKLLYNTVAKPFTDLSLSFDQQKLLIKQSSANSTISVLNLRDKKVNEITVVEEDVVALDWLADGKNIIFSNLRGLTAMDLAGNVIATTSSEHGAITKISASTHTLFTLQENWDIDLFTINQSLQNSLTQSTTTDFVARVAPNDSSKVVFYRTSGPHFDVFISNNGSEEKIYSNSNGADFFGPPVWSKEGNSIYLSDGQSLLINSLNQREVKRLPLPRKNLFIFSLVNIDELLVGEKVGDLIYLALWDINDDVLQPLFTADFGQITSTSQGLVYYFSQGELYRQDINQSLIQKVFFDKEQISQIAVNDAYLYIQDTKDKIWRLSHDSNLAPTQFSEAINGRLEAVSNQQEKLIFSTRADRVSDVWMTPIVY